MHDPLSGTSWQFSKTPASTRARVKFVNDTVPALVLRSRPYAMQMAVDLTTEPILLLLPSHKILFPEVSKKFSRVAESFKQ